MEQVTHDQVQAQQDQAQQDQAQQEQAQAKPEQQDQAQAKPEQPDQAKPEQQDQEQAQQDQVINVQLRKKYRAATYDKHDETYATQMKRYDIPQAFNDFTDGLMNETHINRFSLLEAIDDYKRTEDAKTLPPLFQDAAFNFRPYQPCCIS
jgi:hypothetical protein